MVWKGFEFGPAPEGYEGNKDKDPVGYFQNKEHEVISGSPVARRCPGGEIRDRGGGSTGT